METKQTMSATERIEKAKSILDTGKEFQNSSEMLFLKQRDMLLEMQETLKNNRENSPLLNCK